MFLRMKTRRKDGKVHRYWTVVENRRCAGGRVVQRQVLHLGELNDAQHAGWVRAVATLDGDGEDQPRQLALFPEDRADDLPALADCESVHVRLDAIALENPRQWGACWLALGLWDALGLDEFFGARLPPSRKGTRWLNVLKALVCHQLISGGSDFRFHREWFAASAMGDLLGEDFRLAQKDKAYRCLDRLTGHKDALFSHLAKKWKDLFGATYDLLLYDLTSTYFESDPPADPSSKKRFGYSRDHRPDCVQVVIALVVTPEGFPLAYEVLPGNTRDTATLDGFLEKIEERYGKARRTWLMDRGVPTEETLEKMRGRGIHYLVGTPKGRLTKMEKELAEKPWTQARNSVRVKLLEREEEFYVYVQSERRVGKERSMRRRRLRALLTTLKDLRGRKRLTRDELLMALGAAKKQAGRAWGLVTVTVPKADQAVGEKTFTFALDRAALRRAWRREGRYLLRSNHLEQSPEAAWENYLLLTRIEQAFKDLKGDLSIRPIRHQKESRVEAHIFVCFLAYCLHTTLRNQARAQAPGLTPAAILETVANILMIDVRLPTTDGREILLRRTTRPSPQTALLLTQLKLELPPQPPPKINLR